MINFLRRAFIQSVWSLGLRGIADKLQFRYLMAKYREKNLSFSRKYHDFPLPPFDLIFDAFHTVDGEYYRNTGVADARMIADLIGKYVAGSEASIFEWGCGPGRIIRHLKANFSHMQSVHLYGSDYNKRSVQWCMENISDIQFLDNELSPPIALPGKHVNFIYAMSIFTHLSEKSIFEWLSEIHRLLLDGGYFIFSTHGDAAVSRLNPSQIELFRNGNLVIRDGDSEGKKLFGTFHPTAWVESALSRTGFRVANFGPGAWGYQDMWVVQKVPFDASTQHNFAAL